MLSSQLRSSIHKLTMTCESHPSQWEGWLDNGEWCYIRYRWGNLRIIVCKESGNYTGPLAFSKTLDCEGWDGEISFEEVVKEVESEGM